MTSTELFRFRFTLPYPIRLPQQKSFTAKLENCEVFLVHDERLITSNDKGVHFAEAGMIPADKYGIMSRSRVSLLCPMAFIQDAWEREDEDLRKTFPEDDLSRYVAVTFGVHHTRLLRKVLETVNFILTKYRILSGDWYVTPLVPKDIVNWKIYHVTEDREELITFKSLTAQIFTTNVDLPDKAVQLFEQTLQLPIPMSPLNTLEADIHDKISQKDFLPAVVLTALLCEESIKNHLINVFIYRDGLSRESAIGQLKFPSGKSFGIRDLVDEPRGSTQCIVTQETGWIPYESDEYMVWNENVRNLRNEIVHASKLTISDEQMKTGWESASAFILKSKQEFIKSLHDKGIAITPDIAVNFYRPVKLHSMIPGVFDEFIGPET